MPSGQIVLHKIYLTDKGELPLLYNYDGQSFSILDVMGSFKTFEESVLKQGKDQTGHIVNSKGYLINKEGNIVTR